jgi:hypothetical protein
MGPCNSYGLSGLSFTHEYPDRISYRMTADLTSKRGIASSGIITPTHKREIMSTLFLIKWGP